MLSFSKKKVNEMGLKKSDWQRAGKNGKNCVKNGKIFAFLQMTWYTICAINDIT